MADLRGEGTLIEPSQAIVTWSSALEGAAGSPSQERARVVPGVDIDEEPEFRYRGLRWRPLPDDSEDNEVIEVETEGSKAAREKQEAETAQWQSWQSHLLKQKLYLEKVRQEERKVAFPQQPESQLARADAELAERIRAARVATYCGQGIPAQLPWVTPVRGLGLVLDLFGGFSGTAIALAALGVRFIVVHIEHDEQAARAAKRNFPQAVHVSSVETFKAACLRPVLQKRKFSFILVGGGAPCQGNCPLNSHRKGLLDPRTRAAEYIPQIAADVKKLPEARDLTVLKFLENVASAPRDVVQWYKEIMHCDEPLLIDGAKFGWVSRKRLWFGSDENGQSPVRDSLRLPEGVSLAKRRRKPQYLEAHWTGKPVPPRVAFKGGFGPTFDPAAVVRDGGDGALYTFTREFRHPGDKGDQASPAAIQAFWLDNCRLLQM